MKGLIDENAVVQYKGQEAWENAQTHASDAEYVANIVSVKMLKLVIVNTTQNKTKPGGGFFKHSHIAKFDLTKLEQRKQCFNYKNMEPLATKKNQQKGGR